MKKLLLVAAVAASLALVMSCKPAAGGDGTQGGTTGGTTQGGTTGGTTTGPSNVEYSITQFPIEFEENVYDGGANYQYKTTGIIPESYTAKADDTVTIKFTGVSNTAITNLKFQIVDNTKEANYWTPLSDAVLAVASLEKGVDFDISVTIPITKSALGTGLNSHLVVMNYDYEVGAAATIFTAGTDVNNVGIVDKELLSGPISSSGNVKSLADLKTLAETYNTMIITVENDCGEDRTGWGCIKVLVTDAADPWSWHDGILGEGKYNMLPGATSLKDGETYTYEFTLAAVISAMEAVDTAVADGIAHQLTIQAQNDVKVTSVKLTVKASE